MACLPRVLRMDISSTINTTLREQSRLPLSLKVKYTLKARLERGDWPVGTRIPTLLELVDEYDVSRATVRAALDELAREGLIERTRGKGTYVIGDASKEHWLMLPTDWRSLITHIERLNVQIATLDHGRSSLPTEFAEGEATGRYWWTARVNSTDGLPYSFNTVYVAERLFQEWASEFESEPILLVMRRRYKKELQSAKQTLTVRSADAMVAKHLRIDIGMPIVRVVRIAKNARNEVVYAAKVLYPAKYLYIENRFSPLESD